jgi:hypothetical protein
MNGCVRMDETETCMGHGARGPGQHAGKDGEIMSIGSMQSFGLLLLVSPESPASGPRDRRRGVTENDIGGRRSRVPCPRRLVVVGLLHPVAPAPRMHACRPGAKLFKYSSLCSFWRF